MTKNIDVKVIPFEYAGMVVPIPGTEDALNRIERTHELRVGYNPKVMPFVYFNNQGQLVGFDIAYIYALAAELHVKLIFVPFHWNNLIDDMDENKFDIAVSSIFLTTGRLERVLYTTPTHFTSMAFLIKRDEQQNYTDRRTIIAAKRLEIGVLNNNEKIRRLGNYLPQASITVFNDYPAAIKELLAGKIQAVFLPRYQARAWASLYPETVAIEPEDLVTPKIPVAFMVSKNSPQLYHFMDRWLEIKKKESFEKKMFEYWVLGNQIGITKTRWNIIDAIISKKGN